MTTEEHRLIIHMFARQDVAIKAVTEILKAREIALPDDLAAFSAAVRFDAKTNLAEFERVKALYLQIAQALGLVTGL